MGSCLSASRISRDSSEGLSRKTYSWENRDNIDKSLLSICDQRDGAAWVLPGQVNGQQFRIRNCTSMDIWVLDHTNSVTVENCKDCQIVIAPTKGSLYLRDSEGCTCIVACEQFRARGCRDMHISLYSASQPVIEASSDFRFACFQLYYPQLRDHFKASGLCIFNNFWNSVHDFDSGTGTSHWRVVQKEEVPEFHQPPSEVSSARVALDHPYQSVVPYTVGSTSTVHDETGLVMFFDGDHHEDAAEKFVAELRDRQVELVSTRKLTLQEHQTYQLFPSDEALQNRASKGRGSTIILELNGHSGMLCQCSQLLQDQVGAGLVYVSPTPEQGAHDIHAFTTISDVKMSM